MEVLPWHVSAVSGTDGHLLCASLRANLCSPLTMKHYRRACLQMPQDWYSISLPTIATSPLVNLDLSYNPFAVRLCKRSEPVTRSHLLRVMVKGQREM